MIQQDIGGEAHQLCFHQLQQAEDQCSGQSFPIHHHIRPHHKLHSHNFHQHKCHREQLLLHPGHQNNQNCRLQFHLQALTLPAQPPEYHRHQQLESDMKMTEQELVEVV